MIPGRLRRSRFLLTMFLPVAVVTVAAFALNFGYLASLRADFVRANEAQERDLARVAAAARVNQELAEVQRLVGSTLERATAGALDEAALYRIHVALVERLPKLQSAFDALADGAAPDPELDAARKDFESYRQLVVTATDLAAVDPQGAMRYAYASAQAQADVAEHAQGISARIAQAVAQRSKDQAQAFQRQAGLATFAAAALMAILLLAWFVVAERATRDLARVADALKAFAADDTEPATLPLVTRLVKRKNSLLQELASAVLAFRDAIVARKRVQTELGERMKELACLLDVNRITERDDLDLPAMLAQIAARLPAAMRFPDRCEARIDYAGATYGSTAEGDALRAEFTLGDGGRGAVIVAYVAPLPDGAGPPFLDEERALLDSVAMRLSASIQRRRSVEAEREAQALVQAMVEAAPYAIYVFDPQTLRFVQANPTACACLGYTQAEMLSLTLYDIQAAIAPEALPARVAAAMAPGGIEFDNRYRRKDGTTLDAHIKAGPLRLRGRDYALSMWSDITEQKRMAAELERHRRHLEELVDARTAELRAAKETAEDVSRDFRRILDASPDVIALKDARRRFKAVSRTYMELHGETRWQAFRGNTVEQVIDAGSAAAITAAEDAQLAAGREVEVNEREVELRGERRVLAFTRSVLREADGSFGGFLVQARDITELKRVEAALSAAKEAAEAANRSKGEFLANMSHEIRTPMNAIIGMSYLALQGELGRKQRSYIEKVHRSGENLLGIINDILDFSKIEAGKLSMEAVDFRLEDVMENLANMVSLRSEDKGLEFLFDAEPDIPTALVGDPLRLGQVLLNLANNAVKFTERGEVVVGIRKAAQTESEVELHFWVQDTGIGMTPEQRSRLFQPFSQADASTTRKYGGTGLGLAISQNLVERMNGRIWVDSEPGKGSVFHFTVRLGLQEQPRPPRMLRADELAGVRLLVVDDNASAREILSAMARSFGLAVDVAAGGPQALLAAAAAEARGEPYDLLLMDWRMPGMDGVQTVRRLQDEHPTRIPAVIMVTAYGRDEALAAAEQQRIAVDNVLTKPASPSTLLEAIGAALNRDGLTATRASQKAETFGEAMAQLAGARVLLVEDNDMNQELALELLGQAGIEVVVADNGQQALDVLARDDRFDGVLMDCQMPVMDGYAATGEIRRNPAWRELPVIAMTANAMAGDREKAIAAGMSDHIAKPLDVPAMFATLARWIKPARTAATDATDAADARSPAAPAAAAGLPRIPGLDVGAGMATMMQNERLFRRMLLRFRDSQGRFAESFARARADADRSAPERCAHSLKGNAGSIGARSVQAAAGRLEQACREGAPDDRIEALLEDVLAELAPVVEGLRAWSPDDEVTDAAPAPAVDAAQWENLRARLEALLEGDDAAAGKLWDDNEALFRAALPGQCAAIAESIARFDFEAALDALRQAAKA